MRQWRAQHLICRRRSGFVLIPDLMTALWIVGVLITVLAVSVAAERRCKRLIDDRLTALRSAETALATLQNTGDARNLPPNVHLTPVSPGWAQVTVEINDASASLIGPTREAP